MLKIATLNQNIQRMNSTDFPYTKPILTQIYHFLLNKINIEVPCNMLPYLCIF